MSPSIRPTLLSVVLVSATSCATMLSTPPPPPVAVPADRLIFPAVYAAMSQVDPDAVLTATDFTGNRLTATNLRFQDGLASRRMDLRMSCDQGVLEFGERNEQSLDTARNSWVDSRMYLLTSPKEIEAHLSAIIGGVLSDEAAYRAARAQALADLAFVHRGLEHLGAAGLNAFVAHVLSAEPLELTLALERTTESSEAIGGVTYAFRSEGTTPAGDRFTLFTHEKPEAPATAELPVAFRARIVDVARVTDSTFAFTAVSAEK